MKVDEDKVDKVQTLPTPKLDGDEPPSKIAKK